MPRFRSKTLSKLGAAWGRMVGPYLGSMKARFGPGNRLMFNLSKRECGRFGVNLEDRGEYLVLAKDVREMRLSRQLFVYAYDLARDFDMFFSPLVPFEENGKLVVDFSRPGILQTYAASGLQFEMSSFPEEEDAVASYFEWYTPGAGDVVFDVGAHCGVSTYHFSKLVGSTGRVIAFEPEPTNFGLLLRNIERHGLTNVTPVQVAIAGNRGQVPFCCEGTIGSGIQRYLGRAAVGGTKMVDAITLADAFERWGIPQFCKIDIEGAELEVVESSAGLLKTSACQFALDTSHKVGDAQTYGRIEEMFRANGYRAESSATGMKTTWAARLLG